MRVGWFEKMRIKIIELLASKLIFFSKDGNSIQFSTTLKIKEILRYLKK